jgi:hypothetical protein
MWPYGQYASTLLWRQGGCLSILILDSFDGYVTSEMSEYWTDNSLTQSSGITTASQNLARTGIGAMSPAAGGVSRYMNATLMDAIVGVAFRTNATGIAPIFGFTQGASFGTAQCQLLVLADGTVGIQQGEFGPILATSSPSGPKLLNGIYNYVEWQTGFNEGGGLNQVWINGQLVLSGYMATQAQPTPGALFVWLLGPGGSNISLFDDFYLVNPDDGTDLVTAAGDSSVICSISSANGDLDEWSPFPLTNQNWQNVHEIPASDDTQYNQSNGVGTADDYTLAPSLATTDDILAVQLVHVSRTTVGDEWAQPYLSIAGTPYDDNVHTYYPNMDYDPWFFIYERNPISPGGLNPWTGTIFDETYWGIGQSAQPTMFYQRLYAVHNVSTGEVTGTLIH